MSNSHAAAAQDNEKMVRMTLRRWAGLAHLRYDVRTQAKNEKRLNEKDERFLNEIERAYRKTYRKLRGASKMGIGLSMKSVDEARINATRGFDKLDPKTQDVILKQAAATGKSLIARMERIDELKKRAKDIAQKAAVVIGGFALVGGIAWGALSFDWFDKDKNTMPKESGPAVEYRDENYGQENPLPNVSVESEQRGSAEEFIANNKAQSAEQLYNYLDLTSFFEWSTGTVDSRFGNVCPMDKMSVGVVCENPDPFAQTMNTTTKLFISQAPDEARRILGPYYDKYLQMVRFDADNPTAIFDVNNDDAGIAAKEQKAAAAFQSWIDENYDGLSQRIAEMYNHPIGRQIQIKNLNARLGNAEALCDEWGLTTARSQQAMFDILVLEGSPGQIRKIYGKSMEETQNLEIDDPSMLWDSYFSGLVSDKDPQLVAAVKEYYMRLNPEAQVDQYRLNLAFDSAVANNVRSPDSSTMRRQNVVLGREFRLSKDGVLERGGWVNGTFRTTNNAVLDSARTSVPLVIESLAANNYKVSDEMLESLVQSQPESFRFTNQNLVAPQTRQRADVVREN